MDLVTASAAIVALGYVIWMQKSEISTLKTDIKSLERQLAESRGKENETMIRGYAQIIEAAKNITNEHIAMTTERDREKKGREEAEAEIEKLAKELSEDSNKIFERITKMAAVSIEKERETSFKIGYSKGRVGLILLRMKMLVKNLEFIRFDDLDKEAYRIYEASEAVLKNGSATDRDELFDEVVEMLPEAEAAHKILEQRRKRKAFGGS